jgi:hypothetical protein
MSLEKRAKDLRRGDEIVLRVVSNKNEQASGIQNIQCVLVADERTGERYRLTLDGMTKVTVLR